MYGSEDRSSHGKLYNWCVCYSSSVPNEHVGLIMSTRGWTEGHDNLNLHFCTADDLSILNDTLPTFGHITHARHRCERHRSIKPRPQMFWLLPPEPVERLIPDPQTLFCRLDLRSERLDYHRAMIAGLTDAKVPPPDLSTEKCAIVRMLIDRIQKLVQYYPIDGLRVDTAKRAPKLIHNFGRSLQRCPSCSF